MVCNFMIQKQLKLLVILQTCMLGPSVLSSTSSFSILTWAFAKSLSDSFCEIFALPLVDLSLLISLIATVLPGSCTEVTEILFFSKVFEFSEVLGVSEDLLGLGFDEVEDEVDDDELEWLCVNTDLIFSRFIQSRNVRAGMLYFIDDLFMLK